MLLVAMAGGDPHLVDTICAKEEQAEEGVNKRDKGDKGDKEDATTGGGTAHSTTTFTVLSGRSTAAASNSSRMEPLVRLPHGLASST